LAVEAAAETNDPVASRGSMRHATARLNAAWGNEPEVAPVMASAGLRRELTDSVESSGFAGGAASFDRRTGRAAFETAGAAKAEPNPSSTASTRASKRRTNDHQSDAYDPFASRL
jgi:hypothetical protein